MEVEVGSEEGLCDYSSWYMCEPSLLTAHVVLKNWWVQAGWISVRLVSVLFILWTPSAMYLKTPIQKFQSIQQSFGSMLVGDCDLTHGGQIFELVPWLESLISQIGNQSQRNVPHCLDYMFKRAMLLIEILYSYCLYVQAVDFRVLLCTVHTVCFLFNVFISYV